jgi:hypothetical protein
MGAIVYVSEVYIERERGPLRRVRVPVESGDAWFGVHGAIARHYGVDPSTLTETHATTLDWVVAAAGG